MRSRLTIAAALAGLALVACNLLGYVIPLRAPDVDRYRDLGGTETLPFEEARARLVGLAGGNPSPIELVTRATGTFHEGLAHIPRDEVELQGYGHYRMHVPVTENWILFALGHLKPDTYRDYEFCDYRRALERGTGRCGQHAMALVSFLAERGLETGIVSLGGHAIATARVAPHEWYLLDADYGAVIPFDLSSAERQPASVLPYYGELARERRLDLLYAPAGNWVTYGGPEARFARACPIEHAAYLLKWMVPLVLIAPLVIRTLHARTSRRRGTSA